MGELQNLVETVFEEVRALRRRLHQNPELAFCEFETAALLSGVLEQLHLPVQKNVAGTGVVGLLRAEAPAEKTLLLRADMDALPIQEETGLSYASRRKGVMHACGHDGHMAVLLGTAMVLARLRDRLPCHVKLVFQPAEETTGGALPMLEAGVLENPTVDAAVGFHIMNTVPTGSLSLRHGEMAAAPDDFDLVIRGRGGHGAYPHTCIDPIAVAVQVLSALQTLSDRFVTPLEKHLISVNRFQAGTCPNVIPDEAFLQGTVRLFDEGLRRQLPRQMETLIRHITEAFGASYEFHYHFRYPPLVNHAAMADAFAESAAALLGPDKVLWGAYPEMTGDDFSYFAQRVPSVYFHLGSRNEALGSVMPLHSASFLLDEDCLKTGMLVLSRFTLGFGR